jgi:hypothetical protein
VTVLLAPGANGSGLASMLAGLVRQNVDDDPGKEGAFRRMRGTVALVAEDLGVSVTMRFDSGRLTVYDGIVGIPDLTVRADSEAITTLSLIELTPRLGLPDLRREHARSVLRASREGRVRMHGALINLPLLLRLTRVMSVQA